MSPLISAPSRGYADYQRLDNYDSGLLWSVTPVTSSNTITSPVLDVSRFAYLGGYILNSSIAGCLFTATWYDDAGATILAGSRQFVLSGNIPGRMQLRMPNLGPFCAITVFNISGNAFTFDAKIIGTNRYNPLESIPANPWLIQFNSTLPAGFSTIWPGDYYSGPALVQAIAPNGSVTISLEVLNLSASGQVFDQYTLSAAGAGVRAVSIIPPGAWAAVVNNGSVAGSAFQMSIAHSTSGSS